MSRLNQPITLVTLALTVETMVPYIGYSRALGSRASGLTRAANRAPQPLSSLSPIDNRIRELHFLPFLYPGPDPRTFIYAAYLLLGISRGNYPGCLRVSHPSMRSRSCQLARLEPRFMRPWRYHAEVIQYDTEYY